MTHNSDGLYIAGVDEAGRGALAGPVIAAAVILDPSKTIVGLKDSKLLTEKKRQALYLLIQESAIAYSVGRAEVNEIDKYNIYYASLIAMKRAINALPVSPSEILVDGTRCPQLKEKVFSIIAGDILIPAISAASIIAKVTRDSELILLDKVYPNYGFANNKGYATKKHIDALRKFGASPVHRRSFHIWTSVKD